MTRGDARWDDGFAELANFARSHGHTRVPRTHRVDGFDLGRWVHRQRQRHRDGSLDTGRQARLESLPQWANDDEPDPWDEQFGRLRDYLARHGNVLVPYDYAGEDGSSLGHWVSRQRTARRRGRLNPDRESRLADLPGWTWDVRELRWSRAHARLVAFVERGDLAHVSATAVDDGFDIGQWIHNQRCAHARGDLSEERTRRLEAVRGWSWDPFADEWERAFGILRDFVERTGDARVPRGRVVDDFPLGVWVRTQRSRHRAGSLPADRKHRLERCAGWSWGGHDH